MKTRQGYAQRYNVQAVVSEDQIIVAIGVTQEANDVQQLKPMLEALSHTLLAAGIEESPRAALADAGYWSETNTANCTWPKGPEFIATTKDWKQRKALRKQGCPRGRISDRKADTNIRLVVIRESKRDVEKRGGALGGIRTHDLCLRRAAL